MLEMNLSTRLLGVKRLVSLVKDSYVCHRLTVNPAENVGYIWGHK